MLLIGIIFLMQFGQQMVVPAMPVFIRQIAGNTENVATTVGIVLALGGVGTAIGAIVMGRLADRMGQRRLLRYATVGSGASFAAQAIAWALAALAAARAMTGFSWVDSTPVSIRVSECSRRKPPVEPRSVWREAHFRSAMRSVRCSAERSPASSALAQ